MKFRNRNGTPIDPIPFFVVAGIGFTVFLAWGPVYLLGHGVSLDIAVTVSAVLAIVSVVTAYYRYVWIANPLRQEEVPAAERIKPLFYAMAAGIVIVLALLGLLVV